MSRMLNNRRVGLLLACLVAAAGLVAGSGQAALAGSGKPVLAAGRPGAVPGGFASWADLYAYQDRLNRAATDLLAAGGAGNASIVASPLNHELRVYWHGAVPAAVTAGVAKAGVPVRVFPADYTFAELAAEAQRLAGDGRLASVAPAADGSGVTATLTRTSLPAGRADLLATARVPVTLAAGATPRLTFDRQADVPAYWGGTRYFQGGIGCSSGFSLRVGSQPTDQFAITAGHCGTLFAPFNVPGQPNPTGQMFGADACRDNLLLGYTASIGPVAPRIYTGAFDSTTSAQVVGAAPDFVGNLVQTGGASSGEHFGIPITGVDVFSAFNGASCTPIGPLTLAAYPTATCAIAPGDSGGPVYTYSGPDVVARGTITGGLIGTASCPGVVASGSSNVYFAPLLRPSGDPQRGSFQTYTGVSILT
jgi:hypothetical protein